MPAPFPKRPRKEAAGPVGSAGSMRDRLDRLDRLATVRGHGRVKADKPAHPMTWANPKAIQAKARRAAKAKPAKD